MNQTDYGPQILRNGWFDARVRLKNRWITRVQYGLLNAFGFLTDHSDWGPIYSRAARRVVGAYLYSIKLEITAACRLHCRMCYVPNRRTQLSLKLLRSVFAQIRNCGIRVEILGGEPLLHPDLVEIIRCAKREARSPFVTVYTSGILATPELSGRLRSAGLDAALVTLVSHDPAVHDAFTGSGGSWNATLRGIRNLKAAGVPVYTFTAVHRENCGDVRKIYHFVKESLGVHALFYQYVPQVREDPLDVDPAEWQRIKHWILMEKNRPHMNFVRKFDMLTGNACSGGNVVLTVKADGSVQPCPFLSDLPLGNVKTRNLWDIYRERFNRAPLREFKRVPAECAPCSVRSVCGGGCKASNKTLFGDYARKDPRCLGPFFGPIDKRGILDCIPTFF